MSLIIKESSMTSIIEILAQIEEDFSVPRNVREKVKMASLALKEENKSFEVRIDKSLQHLDEIGEDTNIPTYTRTQIWNIVSMLEGLV